MNPHDQSWRMRHGLRWQGTRPTLGEALRQADGTRKLLLKMWDGEEIEWEGWRIAAVATPGHSPDHFSYLVLGEGGKRYLFAGDALAAPGKLWTPYTTDWDHWTDQGLRPAAESLRKLAALRPDRVFPAHGEPIGREAKSRDAVRALSSTASAVDEAAFLKSYERYTRERERLLGVLDGQLAKTAWVSGDEYTIADMAMLPYLAGSMKGEPGRYPHLQRWGAAMFERPAVAAGMKVGTARKETIEGGLDGFTDEHRSILWGDRQHAKR